MPDPRAGRGHKLPVGVVLVAVLAACSGDRPEIPVLRWYVFDEPSGAFLDAASTCSEQSDGAYRIELTPLPADATQQREQLVRRLAAGDTDIDIIGMDVIWTAEFAEAGWILPWPEDGLYRMVVRMDARSPITEREELTLRLDPDKLLLFRLEKGERVRIGVGD